MPFGIHNPIPSSMRSECKKCGTILASFIDPKQVLGGADKVIPPEILANAKGLAILTVLKGGFVGSGRFGSGLIVARLADGTWSAPSGIGIAGAGVGGQIGFELTDFVFILNDYSAVKTFAQAGSITLGGNVSLAAGPIGRNAEAAGAASLKSFSGVFAYSKTKGLFAGVSLEGSAIIERRDSNEKLYGRAIKAADILQGGVPPPPAADPLISVLNSRVFRGVAASSRGETMYNDVPVYDESHEDVVWQGRRGTAYGEGVSSNRTGVASEVPGDYVYRDKPQRASTWADDVYDNQPHSAGTRSNPTETFDAISRRSRASSLAYGEDHSHSDRSSRPGRPTAPKPVFNPQRTGTLGPNQARAKFTFDAEAEGDLGFKKGDVITIVKRTDNKTDWWTGRIGGKEGIFPSNYVETA